MYIFTYFINSNLHVLKYYTVSSKYIIPICTYILLLYGFSQIV